MSTENRESASILTSVGRVGPMAVLAFAAIVSFPAARAAPAATVVKDSVTGELRAPTAQEAAALAAAAPASKAPARGLITGKINPPTIRHADGTLEQELDDSTLSYSVATRSPDGSISLHCVTGTQAAQALVMRGSKGAAKVAKSAKEHSHEQK